MTWRPYNKFGWWTIHLDKLSTKHEKLLDDLSNVPGITVGAGEARGGYFLNVGVTAHESAMMTDGFLAFEDVVGQCMGGGIEPDVGLWEGARQLRPYQREAARFLCATGGGMLCDQMGLGKTTSAIVAAETLRRRVDAGAPVLVIGPKFVRATWKRELLENGAIASPSEFFFATGVKPTREQERELQTARYWFVHYEILEAWRHVLTRPLYAKRPVVAIVDEGHWIRNPKAKRTKAVLASAGIARHRILLTGTPLANRVEDLWVPLTFVDGMGAWGTAFSFASRYTIFQKDQYGWKSHGPARMPEFQHRLSRSYLRREVADVGAEIPDLTRERMLVEPTKDFSAAIKKWAGGDMDRALSRLEDALAAGALGSETLSALTEWRKWTSSVKVPETAALTASLLVEGESVVVFVWQRETAEELARAVGKALVSSREDKATFSYRAHVVHGGIPQATRDAAVEAFQTYAGPQVIFATIEALKEGVTLHAARRVIIHDLDWIPATLLQAEARVHRLGQKRACVATWMVVERSADELIARHLLQKANAMTAAIGDTGAQVAIEGVAPVTEDDIGAKYAAELLGGMG